MKTISTTAIVALMTVSVGLAAAAPAMAQDAKPGAHQQMQRSGGHNQGGHHLQGQPQRPGNDGPGRPGEGPGRGGMLGGMLDFGPDSEQLEIALVRLAHRIDLTAEQQTLLDSFKTAALAAQTDFTKVVEANRPARPAADATAGAAATPAPAERPDMVARLDQRIALEKAHVDALTAVKPSFEAFFASLTDAQKAKLMPERAQRIGEEGKAPMGHHRGQRPAAPTPMDGAAPEAPAAAPAPAING